MYQREMKNNFFKRIVPKYIFFHSKMKTDENLIKHIVVLLHKFTVQDREDYIIYNDLLLQLKVKSYL